MEQNAKVDCGEDTCSVYVLEQDKYLTQLPYVQREPTRLSEHTAKNAAHRKLLDGVGGMQNITSNHEGEIHQVFGGRHGGDR